MGWRHTWDVQEAVDELRGLVQRYDSVEILQGSRISQHLALARRAVAAYEATDGALSDVEHSAARHAPGSV